MRRLSSARSGAAPRTDPRTETAQKRPRNGIWSRGVLIERHSVIMKDRAQRQAGSTAVARGGRSDQSKEMMQPLAAPPAWHLFGRGIRQQEGSNACHGSWGRTDAVFSRFQSFTIWPYLRLAFSESRGRLRTGRVPKRLRNGL